MDNITELTDLDLGGKSSNFGGGLELLMNNNIKENKSGEIDVNFEDLNNLENELNVVQPNIVGGQGDGVRQRDARVQQHRLTGCVRTCAVVQFTHPRNNICASNVDTCDVDRVVRRC